MMILRLLYLFSPADGHVLLLYSFVGAQKEGFRRAENGIWWCLFSTITEGNWRWRNGLHRRGVGEVEETRSLLPPQLFQLFHTIHSPWTTTILRVRTPKLVLSTYIIDTPHKIYICNCKNPWIGVSVEKKGRFFHQWGAELAQKTSFFFFFFGGARGVRQNEE